MKSVFLILCFLEQNFEEIGLLRMIQTRVLKCYCECVLRFYVSVMLCEHVHVPLTHLKFNGILLKIVLQKCNKKVLMFSYIFVTICYVFYCK